MYVAVFIMYLVISYRYSFTVQTLDSFNHPAHLSYVNVHTILKLCTNCWLQMFFVVLCCCAFARINHVIPDEDNCIFDETSEIDLCQSFKAS